MEYIVMIRQVINKRYNYKVNRESRYREKVYPEGYFVNIEDGARHEDAVEGETLQNLHDCFAFAAVMRLHACVDDKWNQAIDKLEEGNADQCVELLEEIHDLALDQKVFHD